MGVCTITQPSEGPAQPPHPTGWIGRHPNQTLASGQADHPTQRGVSENHPNPMTTLPNRACQEITPTSPSHQSMGSARCRRSESAEHCTPQTTPFTVKTCPSCTNAAMFPWLPTDKNCNESVIIHMAKKE